MSQSIAVTEVGPAVQRGVLAEQLGEALPLEVHKSAAGFYLGTWSDEGPFTRESMEYWRTEQQARDAMAHGRWTQRWYL